MNIYYDFTKTGGLPTDQDMLNDLQNGILEAEGAIAALAGPLAILSGCVVAGGNAGNGIVAINGKIMPFVGGAIGAKVIVVPSPTDLPFEDGSTPAVDITQYATFGDDGVQDNPWANFVRASATGAIADIDSLNDDVATLGAEVSVLETGQAARLESGLYHVGDIAAGVGGGQSYYIPFATPKANTNYMVHLCLEINSGTEANNLCDSMVVSAKTVNGFTVYLHEPSNMFQDLNLRWMITNL
jgi:hypothetical protein